MVFEKEEILLTLQEKANEKIEQLRHEMAQTLFEANISEETFYVFSKKEEDVVGGPFSNKQKAKQYIADEGGSNDLLVLTDKAIRTKFGIEV